MEGLVIRNGFVKEEKFVRQAERIAEALRSVFGNMKMRVITTKNLRALLRADGGIEHCAKEATFAVYLDKDKYLGRLLEASGMRLFNRAEAVELCDDKMMTQIALAAAGVKVVPSIPAPLCYTQGASIEEDTLAEIIQAFDFPLVAKKSYGSFGAGVRLVKNREELKTVANEWLSIPHFYQRYIEESAGRDIRVIVIGGKAVAAMERVASEGEFRSNIELGGQGRNIRLSDEYRTAAERAAVALGLDYCGVDLLESKDGPFVCEVNSNAFFEGIEGVTGVDIANAYARYIYSRMQ